MRTPLPSLTDGAHLCLASPAPVWVDALAMNQHDTDSELREGNTFRRTIDLSKATLSVLDSTAMPLERLWCLCAPTARRLTPHRPHIQLYSEARVSRQRGAQRPKFIDA